MSDQVMFWACSFSPSFYVMAVYGAGVRPHFTVTITFVAAVNQPPAWHTAVASFVDCSESTTHDVH